MKETILTSRPYPGAGQIVPGLDRFRAGLLRRGFARPYVDRIAGELEEHWQDLREETLVDETQENSAATAAATDRLGSLEAVASELILRLRSANWFGRHRITAFGCFPLLSLFAWWAVLLLVAGCATGALGSTSASKPLTLSQWLILSEWVLVTRLGGYLCVPWLFCRLAKRSFAGFTWALTACAVLSLHNLVHLVQFLPPEGSQRASFTWGYGISTNLAALNLGGFLLPLLVFAWFRLHAAMTNKPSQT
ncbi:MAG: hypothetical protein ACYDH9_03940 [Limisphaerales bacterium]